MLYGGLDMQAALAGKSKCRNAAVSEAFYYMGMIEAWGTGPASPVPRVSHPQKISFGLPGWPPFFFAFLYDPYDSLPGKEMQHQLIQLVDAASLFCQ